VKQERSFLKKRTKKLLHIGVRLPDRHATAIQKFFASFFQKRSLAFSHRRPAKQDVIQLTRPQAVTR
jgi:hypothetical protein